MVGSKRVSSQSYRCCAAIRSRYRHGLRAFGFHKIVFLRPGKKYPIDTGWPKNSDRSQEELEAERQENLTNGRAGDGVGIITEYTPFADADIRNKDGRRFRLDHRKLRFRALPSW